MAKPHGRGAAVCGIVLHVVFCIYDSINNRSVLETYCTVQFSTEYFVRCRTTTEQSSAGAGADASTAGAAWAAEAGALTVAVVAQTYTPQKSVSVVAQTYTLHNERNSSCTNLHSP